MRSCWCWTRGWRRRLRRSLPRAGVVPGPTPLLTILRVALPGWCNWQHACLWSMSLGFESLSRSSLCAPYLRGALRFRGLLGPGFGPVLLTKSTRSEALHKLVRWLQRSDPGRRPTPLPVGRLRFGGAGATTRPQRVVVRSKGSSTSSPTPMPRPCLPAWRRFAIGDCLLPATSTATSGRSEWTAIRSSTASCSRRKAAADRFCSGLDGFRRDAEDAPGHYRAGEETSCGLAAAWRSEARCARQAPAASVRGATLISQKRYRRRYRRQFQRVGQGNA